MPARERKGNRFGSAAGEEGRAGQVGSVDRAGSTDTGRRCTFVWFVVRLERKQVAQCLKALLEVRAVFGGPELQVRGLIPERALVAFVRRRRLADGALAGEAPGVFAGCNVLWVLPGVRGVVEGGPAAPTLAGSAAISAHNGATAQQYPQRGEGERRDGEGRQGSEEGMLTSAAARRPRGRPRW